MAVAMNMHIKKNQYEYTTSTIRRRITNGNDVTHYGRIFCFYDLATNAQAKESQNVYGELKKG